MQPQILVVSNPPHREVDHGAVARVLGLTVEDVRLKAGFPAPEVLAAGDPTYATELARDLERAGLSIAVIDCQALAHVPWPEIATWFSFEDDALHARSGSGEVRLPYDAPVVAVYCKPPDGFTVRGAPDNKPSGPPPDDAPYGSHDAYRGGPNGPEISESVEWMTHLDLYFHHAGALRRISITEDLTDFSGVTAGTSAPESMAAAVAECADRFTNIILDKRLENVRPRQRLVMGEAGFDIDLRKLFSFGTLLLRQVLDSVSPDLRDITQYEFGSRLAHVLISEAKQRGG